MLLVSRRPQVCLLGLLCACKTSPWLGAVRRVQGRERWMGTEDTWVSIPHRFFKPLDGSHGGVRSTVLLTGIIFLMGAAAIT